VRRLHRSGWTLAVLVLSVIAFPGCEDLRVRDVSSLFVPRLMRSEIVGFVAGFGTTFAALPDLATMLRRRSSAGMNPRMAAIMAIFQVVWIYYGLLILSRPVIAWNALAVVINSVSVGAYIHFSRQERRRHQFTVMPD
jgi:MtN3 and saliva related transmembrane protein